MARLFDGYYPVLRVSEHENGEILDVLYWVPQPDPDGGYDPQWSDPHDYHDGVYGYAKGFAGPTTDVLPRLT